MREGVKQKLDNGIFSSDMFDRCMEEVKETITSNSLPLYLATGRSQSMTKMRKKTKNKERNSTRALSSQEYKRSVPYDLTGYKGVPIKKIERYQVSDTQREKLLSKNELSDVIVDKDTFKCFRDYLREKNLVHNLVLYRSLHKFVAGSEVEEETSLVEMILRLTRSGKVELPNRTEEDVDIERTYLELEEKLNGYLYSLKMSIR
eukprot:TRINITY_DN1999_c0_g1_i1.p1 TRINITY_DN1999_c0_g1~~TRINITY_DN1999_c0_g1_i1.p1  ORF type:complete len:204 (-),score=36.30 TRINITY_DN1999_c0_g1_i1:50-661(-)